MQRRKLAADDAEAFVKAEVDVVIVDAREGVPLAGVGLAGLRRMNGRRTAE